MYPDYEPKPKVLRLFKELMKYSSDPVHLYRQTCKKLNYEVFTADKMALTLNAIILMFSGSLLMSSKLNSRILLPLPRNSKSFFKSTNGRYMFQFGPSRDQIKSITLYDAFYGLEKEFYFASSTPVQVGKKQVMYLGFGYYLLYNKRDHIFDDTREFNLYLLKMDTEHSICTVLDHKRFEAFSFQIVHDSSNYEHFAILTKETDDGDTFLRKGRLSGIKLKFGQNKYKFESSIEKIKVIRLSGNEVIALTCEGEVVMGAFGMHIHRENLKFGKFDLSETQPHIKRTEVHSIGEDSGLEEALFSCISIFCANDLFHLTLHHSCSRIFVFDLNTFQLTRTVKRFLFGDCQSMHIDKDGNLTALVFNGRKCLLFRAPLKSEPDSLGNLAMIAIGKQAGKASKPRAFKKLLAQFPMKFRDFSGI
ncbi:hypothetical protein M3Y97_00930700 [Aphelenchoides bicaudatus]|nr:hypothetical protein M3Y97_00930700 [Aphelenchoides bicaudatus]